MKIALYKSLKYGYENVYEAGEYMETSGYDARISEIIDVEFPMLDNSNVVEKQVACIDKQIKKVTADFEVTVNRLEQQKAELLALPAK